MKSNLYELKGELSIDVGKVSDLVKEEVVELNVRLVIGLKIIASIKLASSKPHSFQIVLDRTDPYSGHIILNIEVLSPIAKVLIILSLVLC